MKILHRTRLNSCTDFSFSMHRAERRLIFNWDKLPKSSNRWSNEVNMLQHVDKLDFTIYNSLKLDLTKL